MQRNRTRQSLMLVLMTAVAVLSPGCASKRGDAVALASKGGTLASSVDAAFLATQADLDRLIDRRITTAALTGRNAPSDDTIKNIERVEAAYAARAKMMQDLVKLYGSFSKLAQYDAAGEVQQGLSGLASSINEFAKTIGEPSPVFSQGTTDLIGKAGALAATGAQNARLKVSSKAIREAVASIRDLLTKEEAVHISVRQEIQRIAGMTALDLFNAGIGQPHPLLKELMGASEFAYDKRAAARALADPNNQTLRDAVVQVVERRIRKRMTAQATAFSATIGALAALEQEHRAFESGQPLDLQSLADRIESLRSIVAAVTGAVSKPSN